MADKTFSASKFREKQAVGVVLPDCGETVYLRKINVAQWAAQGRFPTHLLQTGLESWRAQGKIAEGDSAPGMSDEDIVAGIKVLVAIAKQACVLPRIVDNPQSDDEIGPEELSMQDFLFIVQWASGMKGGELAGLETFREGRTGGTAGDSANGADVLDKAEQAASNKESAAGA